MCTGQSPFSGDTTGEPLISIVQQVPVTPTQLNSDIPAALAGIIDLCLRENAEYRYQRPTGNYSRRRTIAVASSLSVPPLANSCTSVNTDWADTPGFCKDFTRREVPYSSPPAFSASTAPSV
jgi:hypothetical protein